MKKGIMDASRAQNIQSRIDSITEERVMFDGLHYSIFAHVPMHARYVAHVSMQVHYSIFATVPPECRMG